MGFFIFWVLSQGPMTALLNERLKIHMKPCAVGEPQYKTHNQHEGYYKSSYILESWRLWLSCFFKGESADNHYG